MEILEKYEVVSAVIHTKHGTVKEVAAELARGVYNTNVARVFLTMDAAEEFVQTCHMFNYKVTRGYETAVYWIDRTEFTGEDFKEYYYSEGVSKYYFEAKKGYYLEAAQSGDIIDEFDSYDDAEDAIGFYESDDLENGTYEPDFYRVGSYYED